MEIKRLTFKNFRNFPKKTFEFASGVNLLLGENASGKTNVLEAIYLLASGKSFRVKGVESEMIYYGEQMATVKGETLEENLEILLTVGKVMKKNTAKKRYLVNGVGKRAFDFIGSLKAVYFGPEDLELVTDSPSIRRRYLDSVLSSLDRDYSRASLSYEKGLRTRNRLLEEMRERGIDRKRLYFWDQMLIKNGNFLSAKRQELIDFFNANPQLDGESPYFRLEYDPSPISPERLAQYSQQEVAAGATLVGPHRDDFVVKIKNGQKERDLATFGSRGEQRLAVLWLKLREREFVQKKTESVPVVLLDDIFSELDKTHRQLVLETLNHQQTIITTTDLSAIEKDWLAEAKKINL